MWIGKRGGMSRGLAKRMVEICIERGGVGEEVLEGLAGFVRGFG